MVEKMDDGTSEEMREKDEDVCALFATSMPRDIWANPSLAALAGLIDEDEDQKDESTSQAEQGNLKYAVERTDPRITLAAHMLDDVSKVNPHDNFAFRRLQPRLLGVQLVLFFLTQSFADLIGCCLYLPVLWQRIKLSHGKMYRKQAALVQRTTQRKSHYPVQPLLPTTNEPAPVTAAAPRAPGINVERIPGEDGMTGERPPMVLLLVVVAGGGVVRGRLRSLGRGVEERGQRRAKRRYKKMMNVFLSLK